MKNLQHEKCEQKLLTNLTYLPRIQKNEKRRKNVSRKNISFFVIERVNFVYSKPSEYIFIKASSRRRVVNSNKNCIQYATIRWEIYFHVQLRRCLDFIHCSQTDFIKSESFTGFSYLFITKENRLATCLKKESIFLWPNTIQMRLPEWNSANQNTKCKIPPQFCIR